MSLLANTSRTRRAGFAGEIVDLQLLGPLDDFRIVRARRLKPARSPLTSAMNTATTGTEIFGERLQVTVFPVPVAPAIKPWRFAILGSKKIGSLDCATRMGSLGIE
jgi:hypothetical protein